MKHIGLSLALITGLSACSGGNPFLETDTDGDGTTGAIPAELANDLESFTYDPNNETLTIRGVSLDDGPFEDTYRRRPGMDRGGYQAFTAQDGSLDRHSTAYVRDLRGTRAAIAVTGGQFRYFFAGGAYGRESYSAPVPEGTGGDGGLVSYAGNYVGVLNVAGSGEDLIPIAPGTDPSFIPSQAAEVTGRILINASFADGTVNGIITNRRVPDIGTTADPAPLDIADVELAPTEIAEDGTFFGDATVNLTNRGEYGGIFGGAGATEVAGVTHFEEHIDQFSNEIEYGVFVLGQCGQPNDDPVCDQPVP